MSCDLTNGRLEVCKTAVGGIDAIYFINYGEMGTITYDPTFTDSIETVAGVTSLFKYELKGTNSFEQTITSSRENGTTFVEQTLTFTIKNLTASAHKEMKLLSFGRPHVLVQTRNNQFFLAGLEHGMDVTTGLVSNGTAMGDLSGYTMTLVGQENLAANFCEVVVTPGNQVTDAQLIAVFTGASIEKGT
jgi:hypothetical protein